MNKGQTLPLSNDIVKLQKYFNDKTKTLIETLDERFVKSDWELLNQMTLAKLVMFNRRRGGETQRLHVKAYVSRMENSQCPPAEVEESFSATEKCLIKTLSRVEIRGKKGRTVPVLLPRKLQRNIDLLLRWRQDAGVAKDNEYLFARPNLGSLEPLRSSDVLRYFAKEAELTNPQHITSTKLRKHVATFVQVLNLNKHDLETMATFMGHGITVHRSFYRILQEALQVARIGRLLTAFNNGTIGQYSGKSIDDISLDENADLSSDDNNDGNDEEVQEEDCASEGVHPGPSSSVTPMELSTKGKKEATQIQRLSDEQSRHLRDIFKANISLQRELKMMDCIKATQRYKCLSELSWKKIKNTVHNWIMAEKRKIKFFKHVA